MKTKRAVTLLAGGLTEGYRASLYEARLVKNLACRAEKAV